jgi:pimeloyl-ACP methyl ester carboxylesterase
MSTITEGQYCEVSPGIRLHYASCGQPGRPLVLFLHGFPEYWGAWRDLLPLIGDEFYAVAPDLRGFNLSTKPAEVAAYKVPHLIADVVGLVAALGYRRTVLVAHDWGGAVGWAVAIARPDLVERLVILNAPHAVPFQRALASDPEQQAASLYMNWLRTPGAEAALAADGFARLEAFFRKVGPADWFAGATRDDYHRAWGQPGALTGGCNYYRASPLYPPTRDDPGAAKLSLREDDFTVRVPTLVIWGERDQALRPVLLDGLDRVVPDLRIERLPQATHWLVHEQPRAIAASIRRFCGL